MKNFEISDGTFNPLRGNYKFQCKVPTKSPRGIDLVFNEKKSYLFILNNKSGDPFLFCVLRHKHPSNRENVRTQTTDTKYLKFKKYFEDDEIIPHKTELIPVIIIHEEDNQLKRDPVIHNGLKRYVSKFTTPTNTDLGYNLNDLIAFLKGITKNTTVQKGIKFGIDFTQPLTTTSGGVLKPGTV